MKKGVKRAGQPLFNKVKDSIDVVRKQGDPPEEDLENLENYICDLCKASAGRSEVIQCPFCGRWVCRSRCYNTEELSCVSCAGVIRLMRESVVLAEIPAEKEEKTRLKQRVKKKSK